MLNVCLHTFYMFMTYLSFFDVSRLWFVCKFFSLSIYLLGEKAHISRPTHFKLLFKGQLLLIFICILFHFFKYEVFYRNYYTAWVAFCILFLLFARLICGKISVFCIFKIIGKAKRFLHFPMSVLFYLFFRLRYSFLY